MAQSINFTIEFYETPDASTEQWGKKSENGTFSGLLGEMVNAQCIYCLLFISN